MHTIRLCNCWFACLFITLIYCIDGILYVFRIHASCWVCNPKHLMQLLSYWTCIVVFIPSLSGYKHSETQEVRVNCHDNTKKCRANTIDTKSCNPHALAQEHRSNLKACLEKNIHSRLEPFFGLWLLQVLLSGSMSQTQNICCLGHPELIGLGIHGFQTLHLKQSWECPLAEEFYLSLNTHK